METQGKHGLIRKRKGQHKVETHGTHGLVGQHKAQHKVETGESLVRACHRPLNAH